MIALALLLIVVVARAYLFGIQSLQSIQDAAEADEFIDAMRQARLDEETEQRATQDEWSQRDQAFLRDAGVQA